VRPPRVFLPAPAAPGQTVQLPAEVRHHLRAVLRLRPGARLAAADPSGSEFDLELLPDGGARVLARAADGPGPEPAVALTLALAVPEGARMDWAVEKAVEIGAAAIRPLQAARAARPPAGAERIARWSRLAAAAAAQSRRRAVPAVLPALDLPAAVAQAGGPCAVAHPGAGAGLWGVAASWPAGGAALIAIGPEGGWTDGELGAAEAAGARVCSLGPRVLRVETAAIVALTLALHALRALDPDGE